MHRDSEASFAWIRTGGVCGVLSVVSYLAAAFAPLPDFAGYLAAFAFGPLVAVGSVGLRELLRLERRGPVVDVAAPDVLVLRPALLNVEVNAPDVMTAGIEHTVVRSAGQMTLYLELWDSASNTLLARAMDAQADPDTMAQKGGSVTNKAAADRILRKWAKELRERLDEVKAKHGS